MRLALLILAFLALVGPAMADEISPDVGPFEEPGVPDPPPSRYPQFSLRPKLFYTYWRFEVESGSIDRSRPLDEDELDIDTSQAAPRLEARARFHRLFGMSGALWATLYFGGSRLRGNVLFDDRFYYSGNFVRTRVEYFGGFVEFDLFPLDIPGLQIRIPLGARFDSLRTGLHAKDRWGVRSSERTASILIPSLGVEAEWSPTETIHLDVFGRFAFLPGLGRASAWSGEAGFDLHIPIYEDRVSLTLGALIVAGRFRFFDPSELDRETAKWRAGGPTVGLEFRF